MRILQVIHQYPPYSQQGSEVYCAALSRELAATDDVRVFHVATAGWRWKAALVQETHEGLPVYHFVDGGEYARVATWPNRDLQKQFRFVLNTFRPQIVHFHNFLSLADDMVTIARGSGAAVLYTLHDFGLVCPNTLLLRDDGGLCEKSDAEFFQDCCPTMIRSSRKRHDGLPLWGRAPSLARWRLFARQHPQPLVGRFLKTAIAAFEMALGNPAVTHVESKRDFFLTHTRRIFGDVDLFLAPSQFLMRRYVSCGVPASQIVHVRNGMHAHVLPRPRRDSGRVRFGYIGALHPHKGIELLLDAFRGLGGRASLEVNGSAFGSPVSQGYADRIAREKEANVVFRGPYLNRDIGSVLANIDMIVVPSLWFENSPLTIQEAFACGVPVITANAGGMAEMVRDGIDGLHFRIGDAADLREKLLYVIEHPQVLDTFRRNIPTVNTIARNAAEIRGYYERVAGESPVASINPQPATGIDPSV